MGGRARRPGAIDYAAAAVASVAPRALTAHIDQLRLDLDSLARDLRGPRMLPFTSPGAAVAGPPALESIDPLEAVLPIGVLRRVNAARRDVRMLVRELRGKRAPFLVPRAPTPITSRHAEPASAPRRTLDVLEVVHETARAITVRLAARDGALSFTAGQFLTLLVRVDGAELRRSYSLSSSPLDGPTATITVQRIEGGRISTFLHDTLRAGAVLEAVGPSGLFVAPPAEAPRHLVLVAGGSGITPIASIAETALRAEPGTRVTIVHGSRDPGDVIFGARLDALVAAHPGRGRIVRLLEDGAAALGSRARAGRPDAATLDALVRELALTTRLPGEDAPQFFLCGPAAMMEVVKTTLFARGVPRARVHEERFRSPGSAPLDESLPTTPQLVTIRRAGAERTVTVAPGKTILEAATSAGVPLRSSCAMGGCGACKCRLTSGEVAMEEPNCLTDDERAEGLVLTCVGRPRGPVTLEAT